MENLSSRPGPWYRLWLVSYVDWQPTNWNEAPPRAMALEPVAEAVYSAEEAALFLEGFNGAVLGQRDSIWAVAVPVTVRLEGDVEPGSPLRGHVFPTPRPRRSRLSCSDRALLRTQDGTLRPANPRMTDARHAPVAQGIEQRFPKP